LLLSPDIQDTILPIQSTSKKFANYRSNATLRCLVRNDGKNNFNSKHISRASDRLCRQFEK
jgi:hypothetical protein